MLGTHTAGTVGFRGYCRFLLLQVGFAALVPICLLESQQPPANQPAAIKPPGLVRSNSVKTKLTPEQELALRLLETAQVESAGLQADMHAFVLWQVSQGYARIDPVKADSYLKDAFQTTLSIEDTDNGDKACSEVEFCGPKYWLQKHILRELIQRSKDPNAIRRLMSNAEPEVQEILRDDLLQRYLDEGWSDQAREMLAEFVDENQFPYDAATRLMESLPEGQSAERVAIFSEALNNFTRHTGESRSQFDDLATLLFRFWRTLPESLVSEAIDQILKRARESDQAEPNLRVRISSNNGLTYFNSQYGFRLFQLMPVLREIDEMLSDAQLRENQDVNAALQRYPQGLGSLDPVYYGSAVPKKDQEPGIQSVGIVSTNGVAEAVADEAQDETNRREAEIYTEAGKDPRKALSEAMSLPSDGPLLREYSPRAESLRVVARIAANKDPSVSRTALQELHKVVDKMSVHHQARMLVDSPEIYLRAGDEDGARKALDELVIIAGKLYSLDSDLGDPNQAFKGMWPSAALWRRCVEMAGKLTPSGSEKIISEIPDPEIRTFAQVGLANSLLGVGVPRLSIIERHKNGGSVFIVP